MQAFVLLQQCDQLYTRHATLNYILNQSRKMYTKHTFSCILRHYSENVKYTYNYIDFKLCQGIFQRTVYPIVGHNIKLLLASGRETTRLSSRQNFLCHYF